jgi:virginiamycin B lyase
MRLIAFMGSIALAAVGVLDAQAASVSGTVIGPDGKPFRAAFVQAYYDQLKMTVSVLTDNLGQYRIDNLPPGDYRVQIRALGYKADPKTGIALAGDQRAHENFALQTSAVGWTEISQYQGYKLLPAAAGKEPLFGYCMACHGFESKMAPFSRDENGWRIRVNFMRQAMGDDLNGRPGFGDAKAEQISSYLAQIFGPKSSLPKSPADVPGYQQTLTPVPDAALKIVYVDYEMPGPGRFPWMANPDTKGDLWTAEFGLANRISRFDPTTGGFNEFVAPVRTPALVHSAAPAPDGSVWLTEAGSKRIGHWDPATQKITEYQDTWRKHTITVNPDGRIWSTGGLSVFDPKTGKFTHIAAVPSAYGIVTDSKGDVWFTENIKGGKIGKVDPVTLQVTKYEIPTDGRPRRIAVDRHDTVWFGEFDAGKIGRLDPQSETIKEYALPNASSKPYALRVAPDGDVWYSSYFRDVIGRLDPTTGAITEFPLPYSDNGMRDFFVGKQGRIWFGSPPNNKIGYFYIRDEENRASAN